MLKLGQTQFGLPLSYRSSLLPFLSPPLSTLSYRSYLFPFLSSSFPLHSVSSPLRPFLSPSTPFFSPFPLLSFLSLGMNLEVIHPFFSTPLSPSLLLTPPSYMLYPPLLLYLICIHFSKVGFCIVAKCV